MAKVLVAGGAGYVGSATCASLLDQGHEVWVLDNLTTGHRELCLGSGLTVANVGDAESVRALLKGQKFDCVMHFAAKSIVSESVAQPQEYFRNNVDETITFAKTVLANGIENFVFSSTASVYGNAADKPLVEDMPLTPINPYGASKLEAEKQLKALSTQGLKVIALRYFNAAGADEKLRVGEWHQHETHLIPRVLAALSAGDPIDLYGTDYPTPDGTCIRDYVHVSDLALAHISAMNFLMNFLMKSQDGLFEAINLGSQRGNSVREVIDTCREVTGKKITLRELPRRAGDPPRLIADVSKARRLLGYDPSHSSLRKIVETAWAWHLKRP